MGFLKGVKDFFNMNQERRYINTKHLEGLEGIPYDSHVGLLADTEKKYVTLTIRHPIK